MFIFTVVKQATRNIFYSKILYVVIFLSYIVQLIFDKLANHPQYLTFSVYSPVFIFSFLCIFFSSSKTSPNCNNTLHKTLSPIQLVVGKSLSIYIVLSMLFNAQFYWVFSRKETLVEKNRQTTVHQVGVFLKYCDLHLKKKHKRSPQLQEALNKTSTLFAKIATKEELQHYQGLTSPYFTQEETVLTTAKFHYTQLRKVHKNRKQFSATQDIIKPSHHWTGKHQLELTFKNVLPQTDFVTLSLQTKNPNDSSKKANLSIYILDPRRNKLSRHFKLTQNTIQIPNAYTSKDNTLKLYVRSNKSFIMTPTTRLLVEQNPSFNNILRFLCLASIYFFLLTIIVNIFSYFYSPLNTLCLATIYLGIAFLLSLQDSAHLTVLRFFFLDLNALIPLDQILNSELITSSQILKTLMTELVLKVAPLLFLLKYCSRKREWGLHHAEV